nr:peptidyl-tRNA hydrolase, mitochondrial isoform X4 [Ipomoea batatas]
MTWICHVGYFVFTLKEVIIVTMGIGRPPGQIDPKAFLLQKFNATARERVDVALQEGVDALKQLLSKGLTESARMCKALSAVVATDFLIGDEGEVDGADRLESRKALRLRIASKYWRPTHFMSWERLE